MQAIHRALPFWARVTLLTGLLGFAVSAALIGYRFYRRPAVLTLAVGSSDGEARQIASVIAGRIATGNSRVRMKIENAGSALDAAKAFADGKVDLAIVRADAGDLHEARAVALTARGVLTIVAPPGSPITSITKLRGHIVGVIDSETNHGIVDVLRREYDLDRANVVFKDISASNARQALLSKDVNALLIVAPFTEKHLAWIKNLFRENAGAPPTLIPVDAAGAITDRKGPYESFDIPKGTLRGAPAAPDDDVTTLRVGYYLVANRHLNSNVVADLARKVISARRDLVGGQPLLSEVAAPDLDADAFLPVHPGAAAFFNGTQEGFFDRYSNVIYMTPMVLGALASLFAAAWRFLGAPANGAGETSVDALCGLSNRIRYAEDESALAACEIDIDGLLREGLIGLSSEERRGPEATLLIATANRLDALVHHRRLLLDAETAVDLDRSTAVLFDCGR